MHAYYIHLLSSIRWNVVSGRHAGHFNDFHKGPVKCIEACTHASMSYREVRLCFCMLSGMRGPIDEVRHLLIPTFRYMPFESLTQRASMRRNGITLTL